MCVLINIKEYS